MFALRKALLLFCIVISVRSENWELSSSSSNQETSEGEEFALCQSTNGSSLLVLAFYTACCGLAILYVFVAFHVLCEYYFIHSMIAICKTLNLSEDVAGATFLAAASSLPELVSNLDDTFIIQNHIGIGTIVGSAVFNIFGGLAMAAFCCPPDHTISIYSVYRDAFYYGVSIVLVYLFFLDGEVTAVEGWMMVVVYGLYILHMARDKQVMALFGLQHTTMSHEAAHVEPVGTMELELTPLSEDDELDDEIGDVDVSHVRGHEDTLITSKGQYGPVQTLTNTNRSSSLTPHTRSDPPQHASPAVLGNVQRVLELITWPLEKVFALTIPTCDTPQTTKRWPITFIVCILYFVLLCYLMVWLGSVLSCLTGMSAEVMGFTLLAVGTSLPDALGGLAAAKKGLVSMAISNSLGSNTFDILAALGLPYALYSTDTGTSMEVDAKQLAGPVLSMFAALFVLLGTLHMTKWKLTHQAGYVFSSCYAIFLFYVLVFDEQE